MKKYIVLILVLLTTILIGQDFTTANNDDLKATDSYKAEPASISIPKLINYQGKLVDTDGKPVNDGSYVMIFSLDSVSTSGYWNETQTVETHGGLFNVFLGKLNPNITFPSTGGCSLGIRVLPSPNCMEPKQYIASVPFAYLSDNSDKLQGKTINGLDSMFIRERQDTSITTTMLKDSSITSLKVKDSTITRADVFRNFKAPYTDTADYAIIARSGDSTGFADSTRLAFNARMLQGKDTLDLSAKFIDEEQTAGGDLTGTYPNPTITSNAVTSAKIQDNTIVRNDVATNFKAPYSDTSDYVRNINVPYVDSTRIATNAHKIQGKDTIALSAKFIDEGQVNSITNPMLKDSAVTSVKIQDNTINRVDVAANFKAPYSDTADYLRYIPGVIDSARVAANAYKLQGKDTNALSNKFVDEGQTAGGELTGTYPNPTIANGVVTMSKLNQAGATTGQVIKWNGSAWAPRNDSVGSNGTITSINQATGIICTPNPITTTGTVRVDSIWENNRYINEGQSAGGDLTGIYPNPTITNNAVTTAKINDAAVTSAKIQDYTIIIDDVDPNFKAPSSVTSDNANKLQGKDTNALSVKFVDEGQRNSVDSVMIINSQITETKIEDNAVTSAKILNNTIKREDISPEVIMIDTVGTSQIDSGFSEDTIPCSLVASNSYIFLTIGPCQNPLSESTSIKVKEINNGSFFIISTANHNITNVTIPYKFLIIQQ
jgi:hypothetical protein